jgi:hypothetical protein
MMQESEKWKCYICERLYPNSHAPCSERTTRKFLHSKEHQLVCSQCAAEAQPDKVLVSKMLYEARSLELHFQDDTYTKGADELIEKMESGSRRLNKRIKKLLAEVKILAFEQSTLARGGRVLAEEYGKWLWNSYPERRKRADYAISAVGLRHMIFSRDGWACVRCKRKSDLSIDHIKPVAAGGDESPENLQTMCKKCNSSKGAKIDN